MQSSRTTAAATTRDPSSGSSSSSSERASTGDPAGASTGDPADRVQCHLDDLLEARGMTLTALADEVGITIANLSILKNDRARAIRFSTMVAICDVLECQPGDLLSVVDGTP